MKYMAVFAEMSEQQSLGHAYDLEYEAFIRMDRDIPEIGPHHWLCGMA